MNQHVSYNHEFIAVKDVLLGRLQKQEKKGGCKFDVPKAQEHKFAAPHKTENGWGCSSNAGPCRLGTRDGGTACSSFGDELSN